MEHKDTKKQSFISKDEYETLQIISNRVIGAAIEVHKELGPGLLESVYEDCMKVELESQGFLVQTQLDLPLIYKGVDTEKKFRIDMLINHSFIVELKAVEELKPVHEVQLVTYMKLTGVHMGLLINFNVPKLREGIRRKINGQIEGSTLAV